jgi:hypothetical protein
MRGRHWTPEEDDILRAHYPRGGAVAVAQLTGRTRGACVDRAYCLGVRFSGCTDVWTAQQDAALVSMRAQGIAFSAIGKKLGCSKNAAISRYRRLAMRTEAAPTRAAYRPGIDPRPAFLKELGR